MITVVRLRPRNKKIGYGLRTYTSVSGKKYSIGVGSQPSPLKIIDDEKEIEELRQIPQFEVRTFKDRKELDLSLEEEVAQQVRKGYQVAKPIVEEPGTVKRSLSILDADDDSDIPVVNSGRMPTRKEKDEDRERLVKKVSEMEEKHAEAIELERTDATIAKWEGRLNDAKAELSEYDKKKATE